jgi:formylglycine-generating enzyme required for sulfatase activity
MVRPAAVSRNMMCPQTRRPARNRPILLHLPPGTKLTHSPRAACSVHLARLIAGERPGTIQGPCRQQVGEAPLKDAFDRHRLHVQCALSAYDGVTSRNHPVDTRFVQRFSSLAPVLSSAGVQVMKPCCEGQRVGEYILEEPIGKGAFGEVWKAHHHERPGKMAAVKIPTDPDYVRELRREATLPELDHPNIVQLIGSDSFADPPYVVMELVEGGSLADLLRSQPDGLPENVVREILKGVLAGLSHAHSKGIVHRDLKPENILIDAQTKRAKLSDFGLGRAQNVATHVMRQTVSLLMQEARGVVGTLAYMSPEQQQGAEVDTRADVWAVGIMLFEMLTGSRPAGPELPSHSKRGLARRWDQLYAGACARLDRRFKDAREFLDALDAEPARPRPAPPGDTLTLDLGGGVDMQLVLVPPGEFLMGSPESEKHRSSDEGPQHRVRITRPFYLGRYQVTQEQWEAVMRSNPSCFGGDERPVEFVCWEDCREFCRKLSKRLGREVRLPTEAEWEYACRAGSSGRYCFTDSEGRLGDYAWYEDNSDRRTHPVGEKKANVWGFYDMHGNVEEWCHDWYNEHYYARSPAADPPGPSWGWHRVLRGGGWYSSARLCRSADRSLDSPRARSGFRGFCCAVGTQ